jgi:hypothetical protein
MTKCLRNFELPPKFEIFIFSKKIKKSTCSRGTKACAHRLDFQKNNFIYVFFIVKKQPLYMNFSIFPFSQCSTPLVNMRFCGHVPNSPINRNSKRLIPNVPKKMVFLASKTLMFPSGIGKRNFCINFGRYDLANGKE